MGDGKEVFALIVIDLTEEQTSSMKLPKSWKGYGNILKLSERLPGNRVFDSRVMFDPNDKGSLRDLYPKLGISGTPGAELVAEVKNMKSTFVKKIQYSSFFQSELAQLLKTEEVTTVILCGIRTDMCIFATALDAFYHGFRVVIVKDACASASGPAGQRRGVGDSLRFLGSYCRAASTEAVLKAIEADDLSVLGEETEL